MRVVLLKSQGPSDLNSHSEGAHIKKALRATIILFPLLGKVKAGVHNSNLMAGQKLFLSRSRDEIYMFLHFKKMFLGNKQDNCGLCGPDKKLPWAVCCARLG